MKKVIDISVSPEEAANPALLNAAIARAIAVAPDDITYAEVVRRAIDARSKGVRVHLTLSVWCSEAPPEHPLFKTLYPDVSQSPSVVIVGAGPAGLFAALRLVKRRLRPIILERGKDVKGRVVDIAAINRGERVDTDSNYCFGEGGGGAYSDGKLFTRSTKRGDVQGVLRLFVEHGASRDILIDTRPHIGTDKLPSVILSIRESILKAGGEIHFNSRVTDFIIRDGRVKGVITVGCEEFLGDAVLLAAGQSARDIFGLLHSKGILIEPKPFAMGVRVEHPQALIDRIQYHTEQRGPYLPPASYSLVCQAEGRGVYSFCMCPGGVIAPCATRPGELVTNGWSSSKRNSPYANAGIVAAVGIDDLRPYVERYGVFAGMRLREEVEGMACSQGGGGLTAPGQRLLDFIEGVQSSTLPACSYPPGVVSSPIHQWLPSFIYKSLQEGFRQFGKKMRRYLTNEAVVVAVESRTSSPIRIPREMGSYEHPQIKGLYPCGEGAGYAGGILSSAIDGENCADAIADKLSGV